MTPDKIRRLNRIIWMDRFRRFGPAALIALLAFGAYFFMAAENWRQSDPIAASRSLPAEVMASDRLPGKGGGFIAHVKLADGREVDAVSLYAHEPVRGERVELREERHASGRVTYSVAKLRR